jgi:Trk K+ transport system NAD-binding subunit
VNDAHDLATQPVLICGLGLLGQHCAAVLKELAIPVFGVHDVERHSWDIEGVPDLLDRFTVGDCRRHSVLERAGIESCRAALFTTGDEHTNVSAAVAARSLNPGIRLVIRSSQINLNNLLSERLGNLMILDVAELPATAFALAAMGEETVGLLTVDGRFLRVVDKQITTQERGIAGRKLYEWNTRSRRILLRKSSIDRQPIDFHGWDPQETVNPGDVVSYIEFYQRSTSAEPGAGPNGSSWLASLRWGSLSAKVIRFVKESTQMQRLAAITAGVLLLLHATGVLLYKLRYPEVSLLDAFNVATVLIFDGYSNMFAQLKLPFPISLWLLLFSLLLTMSGAVVMGMVYAYITARVLSARIQFRGRPGRIPRAGHAVVIGMGPLGRRVAQMLRNLNRPVVGISTEELDPALLPAVPVINGDPHQCLNKVNCAAAASVMALTDNDVTNLELALLSAQINQDCQLVIRTDDAEFGHNMSSLAPHMQAMSVYALSAEAFAAAALGERVLSLLRIDHQTVLAVEFVVEAGDRLEGRLLTEVTCGYGLLAILYQRRPGEEAEFFPSEDVRLEVGGRLVVLATMKALQNAEHGISGERGYQIRILRALTEQATFEGARTISRLTGCSLGAARSFMSRIPGALSQPLFRHQAQRLVHELFGVGVHAEVVPINVDPSDAAQPSSVNRPRINQ